MTWPQAFEDAAPMKCLATAARDLSALLAADSAELNAHLEDAETLLLGLSLGHASVKSGDIVLTLSKAGLLVDDKPIRETSRHTRCVAAMALPALLEKLVRVGEATHEEVRAGLAVVRAVVGQLEAAKQEAADAGIR